MSLLERIDSGKTLNEHEANMLRLAHEKKSRPEVIAKILRISVDQLAICVEHWFAE